MAKRLNFGLKVWACNSDYIEPARRLSQEGICQYIELFIDPKSDIEQCKKWQGVAQDIQFHAPHSYAGFNPAFLGGEQGRYETLKKLEICRQVLNPSVVIFHSGIEGNIRDSINFFNKFKKEFPEIFKLAVIENKPKIGMKGEMCCGADPEEIRKIMEAVGFKLCFDFGHAICYAAWAKLPWEQVIDDFLHLNPSVFHLCDGDVASVMDQHRHMGQGNYDLKRILNKIPAQSSVSIEAKHDFPDELDDFKEDVRYLQRLML